MKYYIDEETKGCLLSLLLYLLFIGLIAAICIGLNIWKEKNPAEYCDNIHNEYISEHNVKVCKLRYPILNTVEIKKLKEENQKLEDENYELESKLISVENSLKKLMVIVEELKQDLNNDYDD